MIALQAEFAKTGAEVKWVEPDNLHVTLVFLGEVEDRELLKVCRITEECARKQRSTPLSVEKLGCFPNFRRPRIVWVGIGDGSQTLSDLHEDLESQFSDLGYRREERRYTPHMTLGRVKTELSNDRFAAALTKHAHWRGGDTVLSELHVMSSELSPRGPRYTVLSRAPLG